MKRWLPAYLLFVFFSQNTFAQSCCDTPSCRRATELLAVKVAGAATFIKAEQDDPVKNKSILDSLLKANPDLYYSFIQTMKEAVTYFNSHHQGDCFVNSLPGNLYDNAMLWIIYFNDKEHPVKFPSAEFCAGWKRRLEINQGAAGIFTKKVLYSGSLRGYMSYTFGKKGACGNRVRMFAGPALFLRGNNSYITMSTRAAYRLKDIAPKNFALGNLNLFTEFNSNFNHFNNAGLGIEAELGPVGINFIINADLNRHTAGFLMGLVFANKK